MAEFSVSLLLKVVKEQFVQGLREGVQQGVQQLDVLQQSAQKAAKATNDALGATGSAAIRKVGEEAQRAKPALDELGRSAGVAGNGAANAAEAARNKISQLKSESQAVGPALTSAVPGANALKSAIAAAFSAAAVIQFTREIINATIAHQKLLNTLQFVAGSAKGAADEYEFVRSTANKLGLELTSTGNAYVKLAAASKGTQLEGETTRKIFTSVSAAATTLGLSSSELEGALLAVSQMISKGTVSAEELRGQLGERLPGAFGIAARSIGVTERELGKLLETGSITASQFLPAFAAELQRTFGESSQQAAQSLNAQINRLKNSFGELLLSIGSAGGESAIAGVVAELAQGLTTLKAAIDSLSKADLSQLGKEFSGILATTKDLVSQLIQMGTDVLGTIKASLDFVVQSWSDITGHVRTADEEVTFLQRTLQGLQVTVGAISDVIKGVTIAFNLAAGAIFVAIEKIFGGVASLVSKVSADLAAPLREIASSAGDAAAQSFARAETGINSFQSSTIAALDRVTQQAGKTAVAIELMGPPITLMAATVEQNTARLEAALKALGIDASQVANNISTDFLKAGQALTDLALLGNATSAQLLEGFRKFVEGAKTAEEVAHAARELEVLRATGKLAGEDVSEAFDFMTAAAKRTAGQILGPLADAFDRLGIATKQALAGAAEQALADFQTVQQSGLATAGGIRDAFVQVLEAVAKANNGVLPAILVAKAALLGLSEEAQRIADKYDLVGAKSKKAADDQAASARRATAAVKETKDAVTQASEETSARGKQVASDFYSTLNGLLGAVRELGAEGVAIFQQKTGIFAGFTSGIEATKAALQAARQELESIKRPIGDVIGISDFFFKTTKAFAETKIQILGARLQAEQFAESQKRAADQAERLRKEQEKVAEATRIAAERATLLQEVFGTIADDVTFGVARVGNLADALARAKRAADPIADAMRAIGREATSSARAFAGSATSIREELLQLQGREAEGAAMRFQQRAAELDLEYRIQRARLEFAIAQSRDQNERSLLKEALEGLQQSYGQAAADLSQIRQITLANIEEESRKRAEEARKSAEQRQADTRANLQLSIDDAQRERQQQIDTAARERQQQEQTVNETANLRARALQQEEAQRLAARDREFELVRQQVAEEQRLRLQGISQSEAAEIAARAINNAASQAPIISQFANLVSGAVAPGGGGGLPGLTQNNYFTIDGSDLLSEAQIRRKVVPVLNDINRRGS